MTGNAERLLETVVSVYISYEILNHFFVIDILLFLISSLPNNYNLLFNEILMLNELGFAGEGSQ